MNLNPPPVGTGVGAGAGAGAGARVSSSVPPLKPLVFFLHLIQDVIPRNKEIHTYTSSSEQGNDNQTVLERATFAHDGM